MSAEPIRTCVGCRSREEASQLVRLVPAQAGGGAPMVIEIDLKRRLPGRGAHLHPRASCLDAALRRRALQRALRSQPLDSDDVVRRWAAAGLPTE